MDFLTNKGNMTMLAGGVTLTVIAAAGWGMYFTSRSTPQTLGIQQAMAVPTVSSGAPAVMSGRGSVVLKPEANPILRGQRATALHVGGNLSAGSARQVVRVAAGPDPFYTAAPKPIVKPASRPITIDWQDYGGPTAIPRRLPRVQLPVDTAERRVSGILRGANGVFAVLETNGISAMVQPGDVVNGALVFAIQTDGVILRTKDYQTEHVPLGSSPQGVLAE